MKYAVVVTQQTLPTLGSFIANVMRTYVIPEGQENVVRNKLDEKFRGEWLLSQTKKRLSTIPLIYMKRILKSQLR